MKRFLQRMGLLALCTVLLLTMLPTAFAADVYEVCAAKRIISIVCDDSGSMVGDNWTFANYATQTLIAQLSDRDELYITFMSKPGKAVKIDTKDIAGEVSAMEKRDCPGGTPYRAIETAYEKLESIQVNDSNAQYWLIVTTDGSVQDIPNRGGMDGSIQSVLDTHKGAKMSNGTGLNVAYMAMGGAFTCTPDKANGLHTYAATTPQEITTTLSDISNLISSRLEATDVKQVDGKTVTFSSKLPIYSISVLSQQSRATVQSASAQSGALEVNRNIALQKEQLFGNAAIVTAPKSQGGGGVIPADTYTLTFSEDVNLSDLLIQYEHAIGVKMVLKNSEGVVQDPALMEKGQYFSVELIPVIPGTDTPIAPADLPAGIQWRIEYSVDGDVKDSANGTKLPDTPAWGGDNKIRCSMQIPGFSELVFEKDFHIVEVIYGMTVSQPEDVSYPRKNPHKKVTPENSIVFTVTNEGVPMTKAELERFRVNLQVDDIQVDGSAITNPLLKGWVKAGIQFRMNSDGTFTLIPQSPALLAFTVLSGKYTVTVSVNNDRTVTAVGVFQLVPALSDLSGLWWLLVILAILIYLLMVLLKRKFTVQSVQISQYMERGDGTGERTGSRVLELTPMSGMITIFPPTMPCQVRENCGVTLVAGGGGIIIVSGTSMEKNKSFVSFGTSNRNPETKLRQIRRGLQKIELNSGGEQPQRVASDVMLSPNDPLYLETKSGVIYCIKILG